jgi:hypothetical protein
MIIGHEHCLMHLKTKRCNLRKGTPWSLHGTQINLIYGAIIIAVAHSLNFKCDNNRTSYSSLHMAGIQTMNPKTSALQCTWCETNLSEMLMCSDLCRNPTEQIRTHRTTTTRGNHVDWSYIHAYPTWGERGSKPASGRIEGEQSRADYVQEVAWRGTGVASDGARPRRATTRGRGWGRREWACRCRCCRLWGRAETLGWVAAGPGSERAARWSAAAIWPGGGDSGGSERGLAEGERTCGSAWCGGGEESRGRGEVSGRRGGGNEKLEARVYICLARFLREGREAKQK